MKVLITAGVVYGRLDDNKLVGNRIRGIWATKLACWLAQRGFSVVLLLPDIFDKALLVKTMQESPPFVFVPNHPLPTFDVRYHTGFEDYAAQCFALAPQVDAALMAAAVVNWIPAEPIKGKMRTDGYAEGDIIQIPFILAARVIDRMRKLNPKLTLIGCKMTSGSTPTETFHAAYNTLLRARCNVVVANDLSNLKKKMLVYPDGNVVHYRTDARTVVGDVRSFDDMYEDLRGMLLDVFWRTEPDNKPFEVSEAKLHVAQALFDFYCEKYRDRFVKRLDGADRVFGSLMVRIDGGSFLVSPREKGKLFGSADAVVMTGLNLLDHVVFTVKGAKATLNAPLLLRMMLAFDAPAAIHLHEQNPEWPVLPYAPPGTVRDNNRAFQTKGFNIEGHGCVFMLTPE
jgi:hypothetical protein